MRILVLIALLSCSSPVQAPSPAATPTDAATSPSATHPVNVPPARLYPATNAAGLRQTDLLSAPCAPGDTCTTGVTLPEGTALIGSVKLDSDSFAAPKVTQIALDHGTWIAVTTVNRDKVAVRITGMLTYGPSISTEHR